MRVTIELDEATVNEVREVKADKGFASFEGALAEVIANGVSRTKQLRNYKHKRAALKEGETVEFRPYAPLTASATARKVVKRAVLAAQEVDSEKSKP